MNYINVNSDVLSINNLCYSEMLVLSIIRGYHPDQPFFGSDGYLAKHLNLSIGRIKNILTKLTKLKLIRRFRIKSDRVIIPTQPVDNPVDNFTPNVTQSHTDVTQSDLTLIYNNKYNIIQPSVVYNNTPSACILEKKDEEVTRTTLPQRVGLSCGKLFRSILEKRKVTLTEKVHKEVLHYVEEQVKTTQNPKDAFKHINIAIKLVEEGRWQTPFKLRQTPQMTYAARQHVPDWSDDYKAQREVEIAALKQEAPKDDGFHVASEPRVERKRPKELEELLEKAKRW